MYQEERRKGCAVRYRSKKKGGTFQARAHSHFRFTLLRIFYTSQCGMHATLHFQARTPSLLPHQKPPLPFGAVPLSCPGPLRVPSPEKELETATPEAGSGAQTAGRRYRAEIAAAPLSARSCGAALFDRTDCRGERMLVSMSSGGRAFFCFRMHSDES